MWRPGGNLVWFVGGCPDAIDAGVFGGSTNTPLEDLECFGLVEVEVVGWRLCFDLVACHVRVDLG